MAGLLLSLVIGVYWISLNWPHAVYSFQTKQLELVCAIRGHSLIKGAPCFTQHAFCSDKRQAPCKGLWDSPSVTVDC